MVNLSGVRGSGEGARRRLGTGELGGCGVVGHGGVTAPSPLSSAKPETRGSYIIVGAEEDGDDGVDEKERKVRVTPARLRVRNKATHPR